MAKGKINFVIDGDTVHVDTKDFEGMRALNLLEGLAAGITGIIEAMTDDTTARELYTATFIDSLTSEQVEES